MLLLSCLQVLVVSEVNRVHPVLYPLLRKDLQKQAGRLVSHHRLRHVQYWARNAHREA